MIASDLSLRGELIEENILHEACFDGKAYGNADFLAPFVEVVAPADEFGNRGLAHESAQVPKIGFVFTPELGGLGVVGLLAFPRRVDIEDKFGEVFPCRSFCPTYPFLPKDSSLDDGIVHHLLIPGTIAYKVGIFAGFLLGPFLTPYGIALAVHGIYG